MQVNFYADIADEALKYAVIVSRYHDQWVFVQHKQRNTLEIPGGKREKTESILLCAKRELYEETGAKAYDIKPVCVYGVKRDDESESYGMLYLANMQSFDPLPDSEIARVLFLKQLPKDNWTYPDIQPRLCEYVISQEMNYFMES